MTKIKAIVDVVLSKFVSRKLLVLIVATYGLFGGVMDASEWVNVAMVYIGGQTVIDSVVKLRSNKNEANQEF